MDIWHMTNATPPLLFVDDPHAPETFATGVAGFAIFASTIIITFESGRVDHSTSPGPINRVVCQRMVLPVPAAQALALGLHDFLNKQGLDPTAAAKGSATKQ